MNTNEDILASDFISRDLALTIDKGPIFVFFCMDRFSTIRTDPKPMLAPFSIVNPKALKIGFFIRTGKKLNRNITKNKNPN